jgi:hypothetical protein
MLSARAAVVCCFRRLEVRIRFLHLEGCGMRLWIVNVLVTCSVAISSRIGLDSICDKYKFISSSTDEAWSPVNMSPSLYIYYYCCYLRLCIPARATTSSFTRFRDHTRHATVGRTHLDEWSDRRRDLYLTTHNRQTSTRPSTIFCWLLFDWAYLRRH